MLVLVLVAVAAVGAAALYAFLDRRYSTWKRKGVPGPPASVFSLSVPKVLLGQESVADIADRVYKEYRDCPVVGTYLFANPILHLNDPEVIKHVLIKEFQDFGGRGPTEPMGTDIMSKNLFLLAGHRWKSLRTKLSPTFTSGKIKYMFETIRKSSEQLLDYLDERVEAGGGEHCEDAPPLMMRLFVDTIASVAFGIDSNVVRNVDSEFYRAGREAIAPSFSNAMRNLLALFGSQIMSLLRIRSTNAAVASFFTGLVRETVAHREQHGVERADMMHMLIQLKNRGFVDRDDGEQDLSKAACSASQRLTMDEIAANVFFFFTAAFESSANTTAFALYELARHPDVLARAHQEVDRVLAESGGVLSYEAVTRMVYLDQCLSETLRMYSPLAFLSRTALRGRAVPLTGVAVERGTHLIVPVRALHYDPAYWPDPERFDPERFSDEQKGRRPAQVYLPFGDGPRICIAARLGAVQVKTALASLLSRYTLSVAPGGPDKIPLDPKSFTTTASGRLDVTFRRRDPVVGP